MTHMSVTEIVAWLKRHGSKRNVDGMARYGIVAPRVFGISVGTLKQLGRKLGRDHDLALALIASMGVHDKGAPAALDRQGRAQGVREGRSETEEVALKTTSVHT